jgi:DnaJ-class molecular chaperone
MGSVQDPADFLWKLDQFQNTENVAAIRALLERESAKGSARAKELAALVCEHTCFCVPKHDIAKRNDKRDHPCRQCDTSGMILGKEIEYKVQYKDRMNLKPLMQSCERCRGSGSIDGRTACHICNGTGKDNVFGIRQGNRIVRGGRHPNPNEARKEMVYKCPQCNGTGRYCERCENAGILRRDEYERKLQRIEERYR